ncbi:MAG: PBSX family phage terminase large subunit [Gallionella sp.]|nr:PBSX family phage terminase large subunit [Gallionella sp.]MDD4958399.1 PBSX family phage terminase large subunit [Gallionella sp.]
MARTNVVDLPAAYQFLFEDARYKVGHSGRGAAKSWSYAFALIAMAHVKPLKILCTRQYQTSIQDSVHAILKNRISDLKLDKWFTIQERTIYGHNGSQFIFKGLSHNVQEIKSLEGVDICWVEEAQLVSEQSWRILMPTIRKKGSQVWISLNPEKIDDPTCQLFIEHPPTRCITKKLSWRDNPWFNEELDYERQTMQERDYDAYLHVWEGEYIKNTKAAIFDGKVEVSNFEAKYGTQFYYGVDWGFSRDPTVMLRCYVEDETLFVDYEAVGRQTDNDELPQLFDNVPGSRFGQIRADSARPETISHLVRRGYNIKGAKKWQGSVEDGIAHLRGYRKIVVHERCHNLRQEARLYSYKVDEKTGDILTTIKDAHNHSWDALRYALDDRIKGKSDLGLWKRLGSPSMMAARGKRV